MTTTQKPVDADDWGWWAGRSDDEFGVGPFTTKEGAVQEALDQLTYDEVEVDGEWRRVVYFAECRGLHYECDECGIVPKACDECVGFLPAEETAGTFTGCRNEGSILTGYDDDND
jgi:hypothetical protein